ncbi:MAG: precorrin-6A/cobalt-precorrin-6A reductase [Candidatus Hydrothermarchaeales archaeon]
MIWVLAGTRDASEIIKRLKNEGFNILASVITEQGRELAEEAGASDVAGAMNVEEMKELIQNCGIRAVIDATHPFAVDASINAMRACRELSVPYLRFERPSLKDIGEGVHLVEDFHGAGVKAA